MRIVDAALVGCQHLELRVLMEEDTGLEVCSYALPSLKKKKSVKLPLLVSSWDLQLLDFGFMKVPNRLTMQCMILFNLRGKDYSQLHISMPIEGFVGQDRSGVAALFDVGYSEDAAVAILESPPKTTIRKPPFRAASPSLCCGSCIYFSTEGPLAIYDGVPIYGDVGGFLGFVGSWPAFSASSRISHHCLRLLGESAEPVGDSLMSDGRLYSPHGIYEMDMKCDRVLVRGKFVVGFDGEDRCCRPLDSFKKLDDLRAVQTRLSAEDRKGIIERAVERFREAQIEPLGVAPATWEEDEDEEVEEIDHWQWEQY